jgi:hypothetical protein
MQQRVPARGNRKSFPLFFPYGENLGSDTVVRINTENIDFAWKTARIEHKSE